MENINRMFVLNKLKINLKNEVGKKCIQNVCIEYIEN